VRTKVGGGVLGHSLAHENEAPFPEDLAEFFVKSLCPPGGITLDPFSGSGTTASVAARNGRIGLGFDLRASQCALGRRRIEDQLQQAARPHKPRPTKRRKQPVTHAFLPGLGP
jgi:DNA modification methylase